MIIHNTKQNKLSEALKRAGKEEIEKEMKFV
jgi:hypothetical protein